MRWIWAAWLACAQVVAVDGQLLEALATVESGGNDRAVGRAGEVSRYQIKPGVWRRAVEDNGWKASAKDARAAKRVANTILEERIKRFKQAVGREPTAREVYALWNAPGLLAQQRWRYERLPQVVRLRCERFAREIAVRESRCARPTGKTADQTDRTNRP
jgi:hypothetical protein